MQRVNQRSRKMISALCAVLIYIGVIILPMEAASPTPAAVTNLTAAQLPGWLQDKPIAFVEFYSPTCVYCRRARPILEKLAAELPLHLAFIDVTPSEAMTLAEQLGLDSVPTVVAYVDGKPLPNRLEGLYTEARYREFFQSILRTYQK